MKRREFLRFVIGAVAADLSLRNGLAEVSTGSDAASSAALKRAVEFLWSRQASDGGWHSTNYAVLRSGQALTPYVLNTLQAVSEFVVETPSEGVDRAITFIREHSRDKGMLGWDDPEFPEYPCHATSDAVHCLLAVRHPDDRSLIARMTHALLQAQYREQNGFPDSHLAYGAWGFAAPTRRGVPEHLDISHTRHVLQAIRAVDSAVDDLTIDPQVYQRATRFLRLMQRSPDENRSHPQPLDWPEDAPVWDGHADSFDGGFYFSPTALTANKAGWRREPSHWRSYATATCDGLLALRAAGVASSDMRVSSALRWLDEHSDWDDPVGTSNVGDAWGPAIQFYHYAARSECYRVFGWPADARSQLQARLVDRQEPDGSFVNRDGILMKEDDPLLCTALATKALCNSLRESITTVPRYPKQSQTESP